MPILTEHAVSDAVESTDDALTLGLDILEYVGAAPAPMGVSEIARQVKAPRIQVFRAIKALEKLGYIAGGAGRGAYVATSRLYELGIKAPFIQRLVDRARPVMQALSDEALQSCNLSVPFGRHLSVILQTPSPGAFCINVPTGYRYLDPASAPAAACLAMTRDPVQAESVLEGVTDLSCPIFDGDNVAAVLTIPYVRTIESRPMDLCLRGLQQAAAALSVERTGPAPRLTVLYGGRDS